MPFDSLRERVEASPVVFFLGALLTGFLAGGTAYQTVLGLAQLEPVSKTELAALKAKAAAPAPTPPTTPVATVPTYTQDVFTFLKSKPLENYQWDGYAADATELNSLVQQFLNYVQEHDTPYADAESFYTAIDAAARMVTQRASSKFITANEAPPNQTLDYNWKVYCAPALFQIHVEELKKEHQAGLSPQQFGPFRDKFNHWRAHESGVQ
jgi:hypothetical protein